MEEKECRYYHVLDRGVMECLLCPHHCRIPEGKTGRCRSRRNDGQRLVSEVYGRPCALAIDPVEKKPLYHFHPGTQCLSIACTGCNLRCHNCQNHDISQTSPGKVRSMSLSPEEVVGLCVKHHCPGIAYTYTEPLTYMEYVVDTARLAHQRGLWNILVTAGYVCREPLADLLLAPVLDTILAMHDAGVWVELTNLIIPGVNDDMDMIREMCRWMASHQLQESPLHFSRFFPHYHMSHLPPTPVDTLRKARQIAHEEGIKYVYLGNV